MTVVEQQFCRSIINWSIALLLDNGLLINNGCYRVHIASTIVPPALRAPPLEKVSYEPCFDPKKCLCDARLQSRLSPPALPVHQSGVPYYFIRNRFRCAARDRAESLATGRQPFALRINT